MPKMGANIFCVFKHKMSNIYYLDLINLAITYILLSYFLTYFESCFTKLGVRESHLLRCKIGVDRNIITLSLFYFNLLPYAKRNVLLTFFLSIKKHRYEVLHLCVRCTQFFSCILKQQPRSRLFSRFLKFMQICNLCFSLSYNLHWKRQKKKKITNKINLLMGLVYKGKCNNRM